MFLKAFRETLTCDKRCIQELEHTRTTLNWSATAVDKAEPKLRSRDENAF